MGIQRRLRALDERFVYRGMSRRQRAVRFWWAGLVVGAFVIGLMLFVQILADGPVAWWVILFAIVGFGFYGFMAGYWYSRRLEELGQRSRWIEWRLDRGT